MKILNGLELVDFIKERQAREVRRLKTKKRPAKLLILRDNDDPVISKYTGLKIRYGEDIGLKVDDKIVKSEDLLAEIQKANLDPEITAIIVQLPLKLPEMTEEIVKQIDPKKDVDGLGENSKFDSATATAINWLLAGHGIELENKKLAIVGRGRLVGGPLIRMWRNSGHLVEGFGRGGDLDRLKEFEVVVTATGVPHLIKSEMIRSGTVIVDAGTASENGVIVGDVDQELRERGDLGGITPLRGGVGPLTVAVLFEHVIRASLN